MIAALLAVPVLASAVAVWRTHWLRHERSRIARHRA